MSDKRREKRINSILPVAVKTGEGTVRCVTMNISYNGVGFLSQKVLNPGNCTLALGDASVKGKILYRKKHNDSGLGGGTVYQYGVALKARLEAEHMDRLMLQSRMPSRGVV